ncbi:MAG: recombinase family protein, partial [Muribaculaceae bacterium]|nr:recombinase family protein [Muribaculaceae bacterium]
MPRKTNKYQPCTQAVIFSRVSTKEQEQGASIDAQLAGNRAYCRRNGLQILSEFTITESSTRGDRKLFKEMLAFVKRQSCPVAIVANCVDRILRSFEDAVTLDKLRKAGKIEVHCQKENIVFSKNSNASIEIYWNMQVTMARAYVASLSDNVKRSMDYNAKSGKLQWRAPLGYLNKRDPNGQATAVPDPDRADIITRLFSEYAKGTNSLNDMRDLAAGLGLKTVKGLPVSKATIQHILTNPFYSGKMYFNGDLYPHDYDRLTTPAIFQKCQDVMRGRGISASKRKYGQREFAFRGLLRCATCGCLITSEEHIKKSGKSYTYLSCSHYKGGCHEKPVNENILFEQLNKEIFRLLGALRPMAKELCACVKQELSLDAECISTKKAKLTQERDALAVQKQRAVAKFVDDVIDKSAYETLVS